MVENPNFLAGVVFGERLFANVDVDVVETVVSIAVFLLMAFPFASKTTMRSPAEHLVPETRLKIVRKLENQIFL